jgi:hypothetical protein
MSIVTHPANDAYRNNFDVAFGKKQLVRTDDFPRRHRSDLWTAAERAIHDALRVVEGLGAHPLLTEASNLLSQAQNKVADFIERDRP